MLGWIGARPFRPRRESPFRPPRSGLKRPLRPRGGLETTFLKTKTRGEIEHLNPFRLILVPAEKDSSGRTSFPCKPAPFTFSPKIVHRPPAPLSSSTAQPRALRTTQARSCAHSCAREPDNLAARSAALRVARVSRQHMPQCRRCAAAHLLHHHSCSTPTPARPRSIIAASPPSSPPDPSLSSPQPEIRATIGLRAVNVLRGQAPLTFGKA